MISERAGDFTALQESASTSKGRTQNGGSSGSSSKTTSESAQGTRAALITPDEVMTLAIDPDDGTPDEQILFVRGRKPLKCGLAKYFRRAEMVSLVKDNPFYKPPVSKKRAFKPQQAIAGIYAAVLMAVASVSASEPLPMVPGDKVRVTMTSELYDTTTGRAFGQQANPGAAAVVMGWPRPDGYVVVLFPTYGVQALVNSQNIEVE